MNGDPTMRHRGRIVHLVVVNAFVGGMVGLERTVLPLLAEAEFGLASHAAAVAFIATFGATKAAVNLGAGALSERWGRRPLLLLGWALGLPVPALLIAAPSWSWVLAANVLLGMNQALTWSMTVVMKVDLVPRGRFGLVLGWNELAGYAGMAAAAAATGYIASTTGLRPEPFYLGIGLAVAGLLLSLFAEETRGAGSRGPGAAAGGTEGAPRFRRVLALGSGRDARLGAASLGGLVTNLKDGALWGLLPVALAARGLGVERIGAVVAAYPLVWAVSQLGFGALSDRIGRRGLIIAGLVLQGVGTALFALPLAYASGLAAAAVVGVGTGMVYPTLLAYVSDRSEPAWRASALGVYRMWRDLGYLVGALAAGALADVVGVPAALAAVGAATAAAAGLFAGATSPTDAASTTSGSPRSSTPPPDG